MKKKILEWLGAVSQEQLTQVILNNVQDTVKCSVAIQQLTQVLDMMGQQQKLALDRTEQQIKLLELVIKYGCRRCFALDGEWHSKDCREHGKLVEVTQ